MPVAASALPGGHSPLVGFFRNAQLPVSGVGVAVFPFVVACTGGATTVAVEVEEALDASEDEEFCRWTVFRGPGENILLTSSGFMAPKPLPLEVHPMRVLGWNDKGGATAVIGGRCASQGRELCLLQQVVRDASFTPRIQSCRLPLSRVIIQSLKKSLDCLFMRSRPMQITKHASNAVPYRVVYSAAPSNRRPHEHTPFALSLPYS